LNKAILGIAAGLALVGGVSAAIMSKNAAVETEIKALVDKAKAEQKAEISYQSVDASLFGNKVVLKQVRIKRMGQQPTDEPPLNIDRVVLNAASLQTNAPPNDIEVEFQGVRLPTESLNLKAEDKAAFKQYFGNELSLNGGLQYHYNLNTKEAALAGNAGMDKVGALNLQLHLGQVSLPPPNATEQQLQQGLMGITLKSADLSYEDKGLAGMALKENARKAGLGEAEYKAKLLKTIDLNLPAAGGDELSLKLAQAARKFLEEPKALRISLKPDTEVPVMGLMMGMLNPVSMLKALNLTVSAN
jgi:hypothetical protein